MENKKANAVDTLLVLSKGLKDLAEILAEQTKVSTTAPKTAIKDEPKTAPKQTSAPVAKAGAKKTEKKSAESGITKESLDAMKYNDLKSFAKKQGVDPTGNREAITERLLASAGIETESEEEEEDSSEEEAEDIQAQVEAAVKDMSLEELAETLESVGIDPKGKRQALIAKIVKAVEDGLISFEDEEGGESSEDEESESEEEGEAEEVDYFPEGMTE
jgi:hypothetical protein